MQLYLLRSIFISMKMMIVIMVKLILRQVHSLRLVVEQAMCLLFMCLRVRLQGKLLREVQFLNLQDLVMSRKKIQMEKQSGIQMPSALLRLIGNRPYRIISQSMLNGFQMLIPTTQ